MAVFCGGVQEQKCIKWLQCKNIYSEVTQEQMWRVWSLHSDIVIITSEECPPPQEQESGSNDGGRRHARRWQEAQEDVCPRC